MNTSKLNAAALIALAAAYAVAYSQNPDVTNGYTMLFAILAAALVLYFLPVLMGRQRDVSTIQGLALVNLLLGWTVVGWLACLIWAAVGATRAQDAFYRKQVG
ncbi:superinfection immunity protein [Rhodopila globiformis]|nr:superinfection immunity protein [Rhodopila globiformis]